MSKGTDPLGVDFRALKVLIRVHQLGSFTRAAEELGVNQSAISYTIEKLRTAFQDPLFVRQARHLLPTARCDDIVTRATELTDEFLQLAATPEFDPSSATQKITIACNFYERVLMIPKIVRAIRHEAPNLELEIIDSMGIGHERLMQGEADLLLGPFERTDPHFYRRDLYRDRYVCLMDPKHPKADQILSLEDFLRLEHVVVTYGGHWRSAYLLELARMGRDLSVALRVPSPAGLEQLVRGSDLVATVPERLSQAVGTGLAVVPCPIRVSIPIRLAWTVRNHRSPLFIWARELIYRALVRQPGETGNP